MLESIHVKNLALIEECEIEFDEGLNVLTGETGAGKSILLGSVNLALGARADKDFIRNGADEASVELVFSITERVRETLRQMDLPFDDDIVIITRKITPNKSIFKINGETVVSKQIKELASELIDIHGQHEHQSLLNALRQRDMIDAYGGEIVEKLLLEVETASLAYKNCLNELEEAKEKAANQDREINLLEYECKEIEDASLVIGEDEELEERYKKMLASGKLADSVNEAIGYISGDGSRDAGALLSRAITAMTKAASMDEEASVLETKLREAEDILGDFALEAARYSEGLVFDEEEFSNTEDRLDLINGLKSKFGNSIEKILVYYEEKSRELEQFRHLEEYIDELKKKTQKAAEAYEIAAGKLTEARVKASDEFSKNLINTLEGLNFLGIEFYVQVETDTTVISKNGMDTVEFMISTNPGEPMKPVRNVASGGELSRIMLGIKTILAKKDEIDALIFDEIDSGISGHTAREVSKKLKELSRDHQVILITHLAQIAAMADKQYRIEKSVSEGKTRTSIYPLDKEEELKELARLLGGDENSEAAMNNAKELKNSALKELK